MTIRAEKRSLQLFLVLFAYFLVSKGLYLYAFKSLLQPQTSREELVRIALLSFRFDLSIAAAMSFLYLLMGYLLHPLRSFPRWGRVSQGLHSVFFFSCILLTAILCHMDFNYYAYYHSRFHVFLWEVFDGAENASLVLRSLPHTTAWGLTSIQLALQILLAVLVFKTLPAIRWIKSKCSYLLLRPKALYYLRPLAILVLLTLVRGTDVVPLGQLSGKTLPSADLFLVELHSNPFYALYAAWKDHRLYPQSRELAQKISRTDLEKKWNENSQRWQLTPLERDGSNSIPEPLIKPVPEEYLTKKPKHIVLITMETLTLWPLESSETKFVKEIGGVFPELIAHSLLFDQATYPGIGTLGNNLKIIFGIPTAASFPPETAFSEIHRPLPSSLPRVMQRLGYLPAYFYGGSLAWHRLGFLLKEAGFTKVCGESCIDGVEKTRFGLHDDDLFTLILQHLDGIEGPSYTQAMTRSNHPPFDLPAAEWLREDIVPPPELVNEIRDQNSFQKRFRAYRYAAEALGRFFKQAEKRPWFDETLFVITADHSIDNTPLEGMNPTTVEDILHFRRIPLIFYGPGVLRKTPQVIHTPANHIDLMPTLVAFAGNGHTPERVTSFGQSLFEKSPDSRFLAFDTTCDRFYCLHRNQAFMREGLKLRACPSSSASCLAAVSDIRAYRSLIEEGGQAYLFGRDPPPLEETSPNLPDQASEHTH